MRQPRKIRAAKREGAEIKRKRYGKDFKARVALAAIESQKPANEPASEYEVHATPINAWKKQALEGLPEVFGPGRQREEEAAAAQKDRRYRQIGKRQVEVDWLKRKTGHLDRRWRSGAAASSRIIRA